jgi:CUG-BP- and ETR3-like factor
MSLKLNYVFLLSFLVQMLMNLYFADRFDGGGGRSGFAFAKLFVGSVPRTATEMDVSHLVDA